MASYFVEYAKSSRATCKGKCKQKMPKGLLRFASVSAGDRPMTYYRCFPQCMTEKVAKSCLEVYNEDAASVPGVSTLGENDQNRVVEAFEKILEGEELDAWTNEYTEPAKKTRAAPGKRKKAKTSEDED